MIYQVIRETLDGEWYQDTDFHLIVETDENDIKNYVDMLTTESVNKAKNDIERDIKIFDAKFFELYDSKSRTENETKYMSRLSYQIRERDRILDKIQNNPYDDEYPTVFVRWSYREIEIKKLVNGNLV